MTKGRIHREKRVVSAMIRHYCRLRHGGGEELCDECRELARYADRRLDRCPFQEGKTNCARCPVHCYQPEMREKIREVMRTIGPRMPVLHPLMALRHGIDSLRKEPKKPR